MFSEAKKVEQAPNAVELPPASAVEEMENLLDYSGELSPDQKDRLAELQDQLEEKADELALESVKNRINPISAAQTGRLNVVDKEVSPYAPIEAAGPVILKESQVLYPGADPTPHKPVAEKDVVDLGKRSGNPYGFPEMK